VGNGKSLLRVLGVVRVIGGLILIGIAVFPSLRGSTAKARLAIIHRIPADFSAHAVSANRLALETDTPHAVAGMGWDRVIGLVRVAGHWTLRPIWLAQV
jgi:hypothetical protein